MGAPVFKRASSGAIQTWRVERDGEKFRTHHGQVNGKIQVSEWTVCEGKNIGKANETSPANQAIAEVIALYKKKVTQGKYFYTLEDIDEVTYISPMLAEKFDPKRLEGEEYFAVQPKLDGVRCIINAKGMWSRKGKPFPAVMHIHEQLKPLFVMNPNLVLDGELYNHKYHAEFEELISVIKQQKPTEEDLQKSREIVEFHCYDIPTVPDGYRGRYWSLQSLLQERDTGFDMWEDRYSFVKLVPVEWLTQTILIDTAFERFLEAGYEGAIVRRCYQNYEFKRTYQLMKYKNFIDEEFEVVDILEGKGNWSGHAKIAVLKMADGTTFSAGVKGSKTYAKKLLANKADVIGKMATVTYFRLTAYGIPYLPIFKVLRDYE
jgi:DNA ligase-1